MGAFRVRRPRSVGDNNRPSRKYNATCVYGQPLGAHASDNDAFAVATGKNFMGFCSRAVTAGGPALADHVYPGRLELPYKQNDEVTLIDAEEIEVPSTMCLLSGTGLVDGTTARGTAISFNAAGLFYIAQAGDIPYFTVAGQLAAEDADETFRLVLQRS